MHCFKVSFFDYGTFLGFDELEVFVLFWSFLQPLIILVTMQTSIIQMP
jgi:hypothetical protein